jgi:hypothetical protein
MEEEVKKQSVFNNITFISQYFLQPKQQYIHSYWSCWRKAKNTESLQPETMTWAGG